MIDFFGCTTLSVFGWATFSFTIFDLSPAVLVLNKFNLNLNKLNLKKKSSLRLDELGLGLFIGIVPSRGPGVRFLGADRDLWFWLVSINERNKSGFWWCKFPCWYGSSFSWERLWIACYNFFWIILKQLTEIIRK